MNRTAPKGETFCDAVKRVTCGQCKFRAVTDPEWQGASDVDTGPIDVAEVIEEARIEARRGSRGVRGDDFFGLAVISVLESLETMHEVVALCPPDHRIEPARLSEPFVVDNLVVNTGGSQIALSGIARAAADCFSVAVEYGCAQPIAE